MEDMSKDILFCKWRGGNNYVNYGKRMKKYFFDDVLEIFGKNVCVLNIRIGFLIISLDV